jgi:hypothetical protein
MRPNGLISSRRDGRRKTGRKPIYLSAAAAAIGAPRADLKKPWGAVTNAAALGGRPAAFVRQHLRWGLSRAPYPRQAARTFAGLDDPEICASRRGPDAPRGRTNRRDDRRGDERRLQPSSPNKARGPLNVLADDEKPKRLQTFAGDDGKRRGRRPSKVTTSAPFDLAADDKLAVSLDAQG